MSTSLTAHPTHLLTSVPLHTPMYSETRRCSMQCSLPTYAGHWVCTTQLQTGAGHACLCTHRHTHKHTLTLTHFPTLQLHTTPAHCVHQHTLCTLSLYTPTTIDTTPLTCTQTQCCTSCRNLHRSLKADSNSLFSMTWSNTPGVAAVGKRTEREG